MNGRGERSRAAGNPLVGDLDPASLPRPGVRDDGRRQAIDSIGQFGSLCVTLDDAHPSSIKRIGYRPTDSETNPSRIGKSRGHPVGRWPAARRGPGITTALYIRVLGRRPTEGGYLKKTPP